MSSNFAQSDAAVADVSHPLLTVEDLHKHYRMGDEDLHVLRGVTLHVPAGQWLSVLGRSGSGKSTLLHLLGGLDRPGAGQVWFRDQAIFKLRGGKLDYYRNRHVGFVFQFYHLLPELNALENVLIGAMISRGTLAWYANNRRLTERAEQLLSRVGLGDRLKHRPSKLSGGERQRVAIARALINEPDVLLADEPTGNLDLETSQSIMSLFQQLHREGQTLVLMTHDTHVAGLADRTLTLEAGQLAENRDDLH
jgi:ABC-type lipoprotein export system ATPase subunit